MRNSDSRHRCCSWLFLLPYHHSLAPSLVLSVSSTAAYLLSSSLLSECSHAFLDWGTMMQRYAHPTFPVRLFLTHKLPGTQTPPTHCVSSVLWHLVTWSAVQAAPNPDAVIALGCCCCHLLACYSRLNSRCLAWDTMWSRLCLVLLLVPFAV